MQDWTLHCCAALAWIPFSELEVGLYLPITGQVGGDLVLIIRAESGGIGQAGQAGQGRAWKGTELVS